MPRKLLTFTVSSENEQLLEELFNLLDGHTSQFFDEKSEEGEDTGNPSWPKYAHIE